MFLPVLLVRDFGLMGWVVFALPNVIGAAAMGWTLREGASERLVARHARAIEWFRLVTVVFQLWFLGTYLMPPGGAGAGLVGLAPGDGRVLVVVALVAGLALGLDRRLALLSWGVSIALAAAAFSREGADVPVLLTNDPGFVWLAPVCVFGFALCPYLDPTFHLARQRLSSGQARAAFSLGFGAFFLAMIVVTLMYAGWAMGVIDGSGAVNAGAVFIATHIAQQLAYTCTVHARANPQESVGRWGSARLGFAMVVAGAAAFATAFLPSHAGLEAREVVYRSFMAFYGLVFPAYVWLRMTPLNAEPAGDNRRAMRVFWACIGIAAPMYWMGFIERQEVWLAPGLLIVLLARLLIAPRRA